MAKKIAWSKNELKRLSELLESCPTVLGARRVLNREFGTNRSRYDVFNARINLLKFDNVKTTDRKRGYKSTYMIKINERKKQKSEDIETIAYGEPIHLLDIKSGRCKFPLGDGMCCNAEAVAHEMCDKHYRQCYIKPPRRL